MNPDRSEQPSRRNSNPSLSSSTANIYMTALDSLGGVNSLLAVAVFVGLSFTTPNQPSLENPGTCSAGIDVVEELLIVEVVSFSFFLFSSFLAQGLKLAIHLLNSKGNDNASRAQINHCVLRFGMMASAISSVLGCLFLVLSIVDIIQIRVGKLSCGSKSMSQPVAVLIVLVASSLIFYISMLVYAFLG